METENRQVDPMTYTQEEIKILWESLESIVLGVTSKYLRILLYMPTGVLLCDSIEDLVDLITDKECKKASGESIELIKIACHSPYNQLPLLINDKRIQTIIKWRLRIGR